MKQVSKMIYRISLNSGATKLMEELALTAARSNGGEAPIAFPFMAMMALAINKLSGKEEVVTVTVEEQDQWLCIDMKSKQWEGYKTVLKLELEEVKELDLEDGES